MAINIPISGKAAIRPMMISSIKSMAAIKSGTSLNTLWNLRKSNISPIFPTSHRRPPINIIARPPNNGARNLRKSIGFENVPLPP
ncbi:MAG: hypothetical protein QXK24_02410, partial [Ignisphaera sp.]